MNSRLTTLPKRAGVPDVVRLPGPEGWPRERAGNSAISVRPIVVGYRTGSHSREALTWAVREASHLGLPLVVLFAADYPGMVRQQDFGPSALDPGALEAATEVTAGGVVEARLLDRRVAVHGRTLVTSATRSLIEASSQASLIVVGSRGRGPVLGAVLGSVSRSVAARASCPVVVVPPGTAAKVAGPDWPVSVGTDGSHCSTLAVHHAAETAARRAAPLHVICWAAGGSPNTPTGDEARILSEVGRDLRWSQPSLHVTTRVVDGSPEAALLEASARSGLVVIGSRARGRLEQILHGSVSAEVIRHAASPIVVIGPGSASPQS